MKNLSSLTTFFVTFLFVIYLGVFSGLKINGFIAGKKLVNVADIIPAIIEPTPQVSAGKPTQVAKIQQTQQPSALPPVSESPSPVVASAAVVNTAPPAPAEFAPVATSVPASVAPVPTSVATVVPAPAPTEPPSSNRCIIAISGSNYDVTEYRNIHSGGDVFACGTDMTAAFLSQHPASFLQKMAQYKV